MANFVKSKYEANSTRIHSIRLSTGFAAVAGTLPTGAINDDVKVKVSKSNREFGLRPRGVVLSRLLGTAPNQFYKYTFLPLRSIADYTDPAYSVGSTVTINSIAWIVSEKRPEDY